MFLNRYKIFTISLIIIVLSSCKGYEKLLKSDDYQLKYQKAKEYYAAEEYVKAGTLLEQIANVYRGTSKADSIAFLQAYASYYQNDFYTSGFYFKNLTVTYPNSPFNEEASYMVGYCHYLTSPRPELDQATTRDAIESFERYLVKYPRGEFAEQATNLIDDLKNRLVEKSFISAKLYFDLERYKASIIALNNSLLEYPDTKHREEIMFLILKSRYLLAVNSVYKKMNERYQSTVDDYYSFIAEFPESDFRKEADRIYAKSADHIHNKDTTEN